MDVEIKEGRLIVTPATLEEERKLFALAAAYKAYEAVMPGLSNVEDKLRMLLFTDWRN